MVWICCDEQKREGYTAATKRHKFLDQIKDNDYDVVKQQLQGDTSIDFDTCVKRIRSREQDLSTDEKTEEKGRARRFVRKGGNVNSNKSDGAKRKYDVPEGKIPSIPGYILYKIKPEDFRIDLIQWRGMYNDKKGRSELMNSRGTPETNMGTTAMPRRRHHRSHQGQEEKLRKTTTDE